MNPLSIFGACVRDGSDHRPGGGCLPIGPTYTAAQGRALHALAESRPTPAQYAAERARILAGA